MVWGLKEARSQALREVATDWSEKRAEAGRTRQAEGWGPADNTRETRAAKAGERRLESRTRGEAGGWGGRKADPSLGRNLHPHHLVPPTVVPHAGNKVVPETRVWWEQAGSRMRHPRPWRPNFGNQVAGKNTFIFAHQQPCLGEVEPDPRAPAGKRENPQFSGRRRTQAALAAAREPGSRRGVGRDLAARYVALINPQSVHLIPGSKPEPGG